MKMVRFYPTQTLILASVVVSSLFCVGCRHGRGRHCAPPPTPRCWNVVDPECYGYYPTCWKPWPDACGPCPPVDESLTIIEPPAMDQANPPLDRPFAPTPSADDSAEPEIIPPPVPEDSLPAEPVEVAPPEPDGIVPPEPDETTPPEPEDMAPPVAADAAPSGPEDVAPPETVDITPPEPDPFARPEPETVTPPTPEDDAAPEPEPVEPAEPQLIEPAEPDVIIPPAPTEPEPALPEAPRPPTAAVEADDASESTMPPLPAAYGEPELPEFPDGQESASVAPIIRMRVVIPEPNLPSASSLVARISR